MKFREKLAVVQHEIWSHWMEYLFSVCLENQDGSYTIPADKAERWKRQLKTRYNELTEAEKQSDLQQADKVLSAINLYDDIS
jgi:DICT domain-containing protein